MSKTYTIQEIVDAIHKQWIADYGKLGVYEDEPRDGHATGDFIRLALLQSGNDSATAIPIKQGRHICNRCGEDMEPMEAGDFYCEACGNFQDT